MVNDRKYGFIEHLLFPATHVDQKKLHAALKHKTVLITGASFGIGEALAYKLATSEANLLLVGRTADKLLQVKQSIEKLGGQAEYFVADLSQPDELANLISHIKALDNGVDVFVSNAGKSIKRSILESLDRYHDFSRTMALNYDAPVQLSLAMIPMLIRNAGQIINVSAVNVLLAPAPKWAAYQASKSAFDQWFRSVAAELNAKNVATTSVYLPLVKTRMIAPNKSYDNMPAMNPEHVANIICKAIINRSRWYKPYWLILGELASVLFRGAWEMYNKRHVGRG